MAPPLEEIKLDRRGITRSEIDSAIMLLTERDYVSSHVLAFAANDILRGVAKSRSIQLFNDTLEDRIKPEHLKEWRKRLKEDYTVFKHANDDPDRVLESFRPETTVIAVFVAVTNYQLIYNQCSMSMAVYRAWFFCRHPNWFNEKFRSFIGDQPADFGNPHNKSLAEAIYGLERVLRTARRDGEYALSGLPAEVLKAIEA